MEKDLAILGITFDKRLEFDYHIQEKKQKNPTLCMACLEERSNI